MQLADIYIGEKFEDAQGRFRNYDVIANPQQQQLYKQAHVDIRRFDNEDVTTFIPMLYLDLLSMNLLNLQQVGALGGSAVVRYGEQWTQGTVGANSDRNNINGIQLSCEAGYNVTESVLKAA